jgi:WD40 repeat protein
MGTGGPARVVFVSYAHEDVDLCRRLEVVVKPLVRKGRVDLWMDTQIGTSRNWNDAIEANLARAELAVLLVSADFLASDYIMEIELPRLIERGVRLVCIPAGPCGWRDIEELARVQWPLPPERPLSAMSGDERDSAFMTVYEALAKLAAELDSLGLTAPLSSAPGRPAVTLGLAAPGSLYNVPPLPTGYQPRPNDLRALKQRLRSRAEVGLYERPTSTGLHGQGGVGKSVLAAAVCHDPEVRSWFPDGIYWLTLGEKPDLVGAQRSLVRQFGEEPDFSNPVDGIRELRRLAGDRRCLLVVDDVWFSAAAASLAVTGAVGRVLYTTRDAAVLVEVGAEAQAVDALNPADSFSFLEAAVGPAEESDRPLVRRAIAQTGGVVLALALVAGVVRAGRRWAEVAERLEALGEVFRTHPYADVFKSMRVALEQLPPTDGRRYRLLGAFPEDTSAPEETVARVWGTEDPSPLLSRLTQAGLLDWREGRVSFHDLQRAFVLFDVPEPWALLHRELLDALRPEKGWAYLRDEERYLWDNLLYHLEMAGEHRELAEVATNGRWLARRIHRDGPYASEADAARVLAVLPNDCRVASVLAVLRRWAGLFGRNLSLEAVAATLVSRLPEVERDARDLLGTLWLDPVWALPEAPPALLRTLAGHTDSVRATAFAPDASALASGGWDGTVRLWDPLSGAELRVLTGHTDSVEALAFSGDGGILASAGWDDTLRLWDPATGVELRSINAGSETVEALAFSPDGLLLASAGADNSIRLWDPATGIEVRTLTGHTDTVEAVSFSPGGDLLASAGDTTVRLWDPHTGAELALLGGHTDSVQSVAFSPDGHLLASGSADRTVRLWEPATGKALRALTGHADGVQAVVFAPDGDTLASAVKDNTVLLWDVPSGEVRTLAGHTDSVEAVGFSPDGRLLASGGGDNTVRLWDPECRMESRSRAGHTDWVQAVAFSPDGTVIGTAGWDKTVRLWDGVTGAELRVLRSHTDRAETLAFAPDGRLLASGGADNTVRLWDAATGHELLTMNDPKGCVQAVAFSPDGRLLAAAGWDDMVRLWDPRTGRERLILAGHTDWIEALAFGPDGRTLASGGWDNTVRLWDCAAGTSLYALSRHTERVETVAFSPDGRLLASGGWEHTVMLWDPATGFEVQRLAGHTDRIETLAFSPDGRFLASGAGDHTVRVWDPVTGSELTTLSLGGPVLSTAWSPDGQSLAVAFGSYWAYFRVRTAID